MHDAVAATTELALDHVRLAWVVLAIVLLPFLSALTLIFFGRKLPRGGDWLATGSIVVCALLAIHLFWEFVVEHGAPG